MRKILKLQAAICTALFSVALAVHPACAYTETDVLNMPGHGTISPSYLVVHSTANPGATAANHVVYWTRQGNGSTMAHWVIDWTNGGQVYQMAASNRLVWHVGSGNRYSVGLEICEATNSADFYTVFDQAARWCADFLNSRGWGIDRMVSHNEARMLWGGTDHTDPLPYFSRFGESWSSFESRVSYYLARSADSDSPAVVDQNQATTVDTGVKVGSNLPGGTYMVNCSTLNIRAGHSVDSADVGNYYRGQTVILDNTYYIEDGYVWGAYIAYSGNRRYVAVGRATGQVETGDYLIRK